MCSVHFIIIRGKWFFILGHASEPIGRRLIYSQNAFGVYSAVLPEQRKGASGAHRTYTNYKQTVSRE